MCGFIFDHDLNDPAGNASNSSTQLVAALKQYNHFASFLFPSEYVQCTTPKYSGNKAIQISLR